MESRSLCGATATGPVVRIHPDRASAVMVAVIDNRNARATRTGAIPQSETALVLHRLWLTKGFCRPFGVPDPTSPRAVRRGLRTLQAAMPAPIGHDTPV